MNVYYITKKALTHRLRAPSLLPGIALPIKVTDSYMTTLIRTDAIFGLSMTILLLNL